MQKPLWYCLFFLLFHFTAKAQLRLANIFTDNMVLQQQTNAAIWGWATPGSTITLRSSWDNNLVKAKSDASGKWLAHLKTPSAGGPYEIVITDGKAIRLKNVLIGEVWLCSGQSNMEMPVKGYKGQPVTGSNDAIVRSKNPMLRLYTVPRAAHTTSQDTTKPSAWSEAAPETVSNFSATAYFFGKLLNDVINVPVGLINSSYGTSEIQSWMTVSSLKPFPEISIPAKNDTIKVPYRTPTALYNGMISGIVGYAIKGVIWYQGESNYENASQYERLLPAMVKEWRTLWSKGMQDTFSFYYAQIAPFNYSTFHPNDKRQSLNAAYLRDAQRKATQFIPRSGMAVLMDIGEENNIHPSDKRTGGERLALLALGNDYRIEGFGYKSPTYDTLIIKDTVAEVRFRGAQNWLTAYGRELKHFQIAGNDKIFYPAKTTIYRNTVRVSSPLVKAPVAVRYAFHDFVVGELFSTEGLPVSSFRTDNW